MTQPVPPGQQAPPQQPPTGPDREEQAAAIAATIGAVYAGAEITGLAAVTAAVYAVTTARHKALQIALTETRRLGRALTAAFGHARAVSTRAVHNMPHGDLVIASHVDKVLSQAERGTVSRALTDYQRIVRQVTPGNDQAQASLHRQIVSEAISKTRGGLPGTSTSLSATQAAQKALDDMGAHGLTAYTDRSGRRWSLASYTEMAVRTEVSNRLDGKLAGFLQASGTDVVWTYTDSSEGSCPRCEPWLNKVLSLSGATGQVSVRLHDGIMFTRQIAGSLAEAKAAGFRHVNCRCAFAGLASGVNLTQLGHGAEPPAKAAAAYGASQHQRTLERRVRAARRQAATALTPQARAKARVRVAAAVRASAEHRRARGVRQTKANVAQREHPARQSRDREW